jgi:hypothetical protein
MSKKKNHISYKLSGFWQDARSLMPAKNQPLPANLTRYDISKADDTLEGEAE